GQKLLDLSLDDLGYTEFARGNFAKAEEYYEANYKNLEKAKKDKQAFASFYRGSVSLFSSIEQDSLKLSTLKERLIENLKFLNKIYQTEMNQCLSSIAENSENYLYCKKIFYENYTDFDPVLAYTYFYLGEASLVSEDYESAFEYYGKALSLFQTPMEIPISEIGLESDPFTKKERTRFALAQAVIYFRMGDSEKYTKAIQDAYNLAVEFEFEKEFILIQLIRAEVDFLFARKDRDFQKVLEKLETIETKLKNSIGLLYDLEENTLNYVYTLKSYCYVHLRNKEALRQTRENLFSIVFFRQLLINEFRFQDTELFRNLNKLQFLVGEDREYSLKIESALEKEQSPKEIIKAKEKNYKKILASISEIKKKFPKGSDAFSWLEFSKPKKLIPAEEEVVVEIYN
ncbi:MAG: hypothetical protein N3A69_14355, partial [Leptospiraceae bacterium]|nr:hypothetical protein [Leptospiraceae bacterium]